ncbi:MAG: lysophospholipase [Candidatus Hydrogenedentes bacterium]|nr:lysophospholipase [Candidatus Hydrogenedentota bacterium]
MTTGTFRTHDNQDLATQSWEVGQEPRASLIIIHGFGHHGACFQEVAQHLNHAGVNVYSFDQRGHGKSPGKRGFINSFDDTISDVRTFMQSIKANVEGRPLFLMGHSMGGLVLGVYVLRHAPAVRGLIFSSALLKIPDSVPPFLIKLAAFLGKYLPTLPVQGVNFKAVSRDPAAIEEMLNDPLRYTGRMQARTGAEIGKAIAELNEGMDRIEDPLLILHGTADQLTDPSGSKNLYDRSKSTDKTLRIFEHGYHELYNDLDKSAFMTEITDWMLKRS